MKLNTRRLDQDEHSVHLEGDELRTVIAEAVAKAAKVKLSDAGVKATVELFTPVGREPTADVTIIFDREAAKDPEAAAKANAKPEATEAPAPTEPAIPPATNKKPAKA